MPHSKFILSFFLLCALSVCFGAVAGEPVFTARETLYSTRNGAAIGDLTLSIETKNAKNNEWTLVIGDKGNNFFDSRDGKTLWIFSRKTSAND
ncbi:MAG: hypothetical protein LBE56_00225, partial [Tannerella sp.]|nr:hypothetical protein [Tannerella sp.]